MYSADASLEHPGLPRKSRFSLPCQLGEFLVEALEPILSQAMDYVLEGYGYLAIFLSV
jgi:hypothetical protein